MPEEHHARRQDRLHGGRGLGVSLDFGNGRLVELVNLAHGFGQRRHGHGQVGLRVGGDGVALLGLLADARRVGLDLCLLRVGVLPLRHDDHQELLARLRRRRHHDGRLVEVDAKHRHALLSLFELGQPVGQLLLLPPELADLVLEQRPVPWEA